MASTGSSRLRLSIIRCGLARARLALCFPAVASTQAAVLADLAPVQDFHILALIPALFALVDFLPVESLLPVAETDTASMSRAALSSRYAEPAGHYLLLSERYRLCHALRGQRVGTGFPASRNCQFRALNRGVDWILGNDAVKLQRIVDSCFSAASSG